VPRELEPSRILIFRPGSLGDTVVCLPSLHLIARRFPNADRRMLANFPVEGVSVPVPAILESTGLVSGYFEVDHAKIRGRLREQWKLCRQIRRWKPDLLIVLTRVRGIKQHLMELAFFKLCGVSSMLNMQLGKRTEKHHWVPGRRRYEYEAERLARSIHELGDCRLDDPASWSLNLSAGERARALEAVQQALGTQGLIVCSVGTAVEVKDWGVDNWSTFVRQLGRRANGYGLALVGASSEFERSEQVRADWCGPSINLCGRLTVRETAAVMERAAIYLGHDSGPMHLAAIAGVPSVAIFTARERAGVWFPYGNQHRVIYHAVPCAGCGLSKCTVYSKRCITSITVGEVLEATEDLLRRPRLSRFSSGASTEGAVSVSVRDRW
jgi:heptosyltransferase III